MQVADAAGATGARPKHSVNREYVSLALSQATVDQTDTGSLASEDKPVDTETAAMETEEANRQRAPLMHSQKWGGGGSMSNKG